MNTFHTTRPIAADQAQRYAKASGDFNPIHLDDAYAKRVGLKGCILHGLCTVAFVADAATQAVGNSRALRRLKIRFSQPVYLGDRLDISGETLEDNAGVIRYRIRCANQDGVDVLSGAQAEVSARSEAPPMPETAAKFQGDPLAPTTFEVTEAGIRQYAQAVGIYLDQQGTVFAPAMFCATFTMEPFKKEFDKRLKDDPDTKILHGSQEFEFYRALSPGDVVTTVGGIERSSKKGGQELTYFITKSHDAQGRPVVFGRSLVVFQGPA